MKKSHLKQIIKEEINEIFLKKNEIKNKAITWWNGLSDIKQYEYIYKYYPEKEYREEELTGYEIYKIYIQEKIKT